jgi:AAA domain
MADEFEGWDEREAEERRKQQPEHKTIYEDALIVRVLSPAAGRPEGYRAIPILPFGGFDSVSVPINGPSEAANGSAASVGEVSEAELLGEWDAGDDDQIPPPRGWLLGNSFCRGFVSSLLGDGGVGKTAMRYAQALSLATGRSLTGEHVFQRSRVLIVSLEDGRDEQRRRIKAACLHHGIKRNELKGWLYLAALGKASGKLMTLDPHGRPVLGALAAKLVRTIAARKIDLVILDPFVKAHTINENDNSAIDEVAQILTDMSVKFDIAVDVPHHISKGPADPGNANRGRGASSSKDAFRLVDTATRMSEEEGKAFGLGEVEWRSLIRIDNAKVNIAPIMSARWFKLVSVNIGNATELYPNGDNVQTVEPWSPPGLFAELSVPVLNAILDDIDAGISDGNRYSDAPNATDRAAWRVIQRHCGKSEGPARQIIKTWVGSGLLVHKAYENPITRKEVKGLWVDPVKRPS